MGRWVYPGTLGAAHDAGPRVYVPSREVFRSFKHAADVHKPSVGARDGYPHVIVPLPPFRVVKCPTAVSARCFCLLGTPLYLLVVFAVVYGFLPLRDR